MAQALALPRRAHPYRDLDVVDERAPRFLQATVALGAIVTLATGWWAIVALLALQLAVGLVFGRRYCLPCVLYFELVQPRIGEGQIEDARPPRFANILGATFLGAATLAFAAGAEAIGYALAGLVALLASIAALTGLCVGCEAYKLIARLRGVRPGHLDQLDLTELDTGAERDGLVVHFTHPLCTGCREVEESLTAEGRTFTRVDVSRRPDLARKYHVSVVPTTVAVDSTGRVVQRLA
jgi:hypothetical protein